MFCSTEKVIWFLRLLLSFWSKRIENRRSRWEQNKQRRIFVIMFQQQQLNDNNDLPHKLISSKWLICCFSFSTLHWVINFCRFSARAETWTLARLRATVSWHRKRCWNEQQQHEGKKVTKLDDEPVGSSQRRILPHVGSYIACSTKWILFDVSMPLLFYSPNVGTKFNCNSKEMVVVVASEMSTSFRQVFKIWMSARWMEWDVCCWPTFWKFVSLLGRARLASTSWHGLLISRAGLRIETLFISNEQYWKSLVSLRLRSCQQRTRQEEPQLCSNYLLLLIERRNWRGKQIFPHFEKFKLLPEEAKVNFCWSARDSQDLIEVFFLFYYLSEGETV